MSMDCCGAKHPSYAGISCTKPLGHGGEHCRKKGPDCTGYYENIWWPYESGMTAIEAMKEFLECEGCSVEQCPDIEVRVCYFRQMSKERIAAYECVRKDCEAYHHCSSEEGKTEGICEDCFAFGHLKEKAGLWS